MGLQVINYNSGIKQSKVVNLWLKKLKIRSLDTSVLKYRKLGQHHYDLHQHPSLQLR